MSRFSLIGAYERFGCFLIDAGAHWADKAWHLRQQRGNAEDQRVIAALSQGFAEAADRHDTQLR
jgi:hypothetical protein